MYIPKVKASQARERRPRVLPAQGFRLVKREQRRTSCWPNGPIVHFRFRRAWINSPNPAAISRASVPGSGTAETA